MQHCLLAELIACWAGRHLGYSQKVKGLPVQNANQCVSEDVAELASEITRYLQNHYCVADTLEGISQWWILRQRLQEERSRVEQAMEYLCTQGIVETHRLPDGAILYSPTAVKKDARTTN